MVLIGAFKFIVGKKEKYLSISKEKMMYLLEL